MLISNTTWYSPNEKTPELNTPIWLYCRSRAIPGTTFVMNGFYGQYSSEDAKAIGFCKMDSMSYEDLLIPQEYIIAWTGEQELTKQLERQLKDGKEKVKIEGNKHDS